MGKRKTNVTTPPTAVPATMDMSALVAMLASAGLRVAPVAPTAKMRATPVAPVTARDAMPATRYEMLLGYFSETQARALDALAVEAATQASENKLAAVADDVRRAKHAAVCDKLIAEAWPKGSPCPYEAWAAFRHDVYAYGADGMLLPKDAPKLNQSATSFGRALAAAYVRVHGEGSLPRKSAATGAASKGDSIGRVLLGIDARLKALAKDADRLQRCKQNVEPAVLATFAAAVKAVCAARDALRKAA